MWRSQPLCGRTGEDEGVDGAEGEAASAAVTALVSHSQPGRADDLLAATPSEGTQPAPPEAVARRLAVRMTRVWVAGGEAAAMRALEAALGALGLPWRRAAAGGAHLDVECGAEVRMRAVALRVAGGGAEGADARTLFEFRRLRGCGLHFKRRFAQVRDALRSARVPDPT